MKYTGAQIVLESLIREGVKTIFGYPGGATLPIYDAFSKYPNIHHVLTRHEQGMAHMADGFSRSGGGIGVAMSTSGPGATNMVTGIATAMMDSSPAIYITGQVASHLIGYDAFQETDITGITLPITKHNYLVTDVNEIGHVIREAFYIARTGRPGPVLIDIAKDAQQNEIEWEYDDTPITLPGYRPDRALSSAAMQKAVELIQNAKRPVILAGRGVLISNAMTELRNFAEKTSTPVAMTLLGLGGFPHSHPLSLGMMGMHGESWTNRAIQEADLLLAFGMRFDDRVTGTLKTYAPNARKIHIDIDPSEINKNVRVDAALVGDLREVLTQLQPHVCDCDHEEWLAHVQKMKADVQPHDIQNLPDVGKLYAPHVLNDLWRHTNGDALLVTDVGQHQMWAAQYYWMDKPHKLITSGGLGTMGFGIPAAIGAKIGKPSENVWLIVGDGGFQMTAAELSTAAQENVKVNIALINNGYLGMVRQWQEFFYDKRYNGTPLRNPDFVKLVEAHGLKAIRVTKRADVAAAFREAEQTPGTVVIDFQVVPEDSVYPMVPAGAALDNMIRRPHSEKELEFGEI